MGERAPPLGRESAGLPGLDLFTTQLVEDDLRQSTQSILSPKENKATENSQFRSNRVIKGCCFPLNAFLWIYNLLAALLSVALFLFLYIVGKPLCLVLL